MTIKRGEQIIGGVAKTSMSIRIVTILVLALTAGFLIGGLFERGLLIAGIILGIIALFCYLFAPVAYEVTGGCLTVLLHVGKKNFGPVISCTGITEHLPFSIRLFGNGGLFAGIGIFWNRPYGGFRAYVTSARHTDMVLVQTRNFKVLITPDDPQKFLELTQVLESVH